MGENKPFFSVITPTYNRAHCLPEAIESVQNQTYRDYEHIIIDDGSTDETETLCKDFAATDNRIKHIKQTNQGRSKARNVGIEAASGRYVCFLDSDDVWASDYLIHLHHIAAQTGHSFLASKMVWVSEKSRTKTERTIQSFGYTEVHKVIELEVGMNVCINKSLFADCRFNESIHINEDFELWSRIICRNKIGVSAVPESHYLVTTPEVVGELSNSELNKILATQTLIRKNECLEKYVPRRFWKKRTESLQYRLTWNLILSGNRYEVLKSATRFLMKYPSHPARKSLIVALLYALPGGLLLKKLVASINGINVE